jgi:hypothetical protein
MPWAFAASDRAQSSIYFPGTLRRGEGVVKSLGSFQAGTASGLRTQKCKIKNKKPTCFRTRSIQEHSGAGGLNLWSLWGALPLTHRFFWSAGGLNYFSEIREIKRPSPKRSRASRMFSRHWAFAASDRAQPSFYFSGTLRGGEGWSKVWDLQAGTARLPRANFRKIPKTFFYLCSMPTSQLSERQLDFTGPPRGQKHRGT